VIFIASKLEGNSRAFQLYFQSSSHVSTIHCFELFYDVYILLFHLQKKIEELLNIKDDDDDGDDDEMNVEDGQQLMQPTIKQRPPSSFDTMKIQFLQSTLLYAQEKLYACLQIIHNCYSS
jgi:hypothetical protein